MLPSILFILLKTMEIVKKKTYKENYLLKTGIPVFICFTLLAIILDHFKITDPSSRETRFNDINNVTDMIIGGVVIAPLFEELFFRGVFTGKKYLKYISYFGTAFLVIMQQSYFLIPLLILFIILFELKAKNNFQKYSFFINALLFSLMHYKFSDLLNVSSYPSILGTAGLALVLIWLVLNIGLWSSILAHFIVNGTLISTTIIAYENSDRTLEKVETNDFVMTYQYVSLFDNKSSTEFSQSKGIKVSNTSVFIINKLVCPNTELKKMYFGKFNITIKRKQNSTKKLDCQTFHELLNKSKIAEE
ncbi:CPBP family intramembrane glutamic endopeptidase [Chryseobacterium sp.]|uniref:CPBP family intramembrane glutamic endopeptidase n=1 Tax=Chryseobacterium sp. TaxID=1871047 RepID=UPI0012C1B670|nr:CPBP family intramembrane glutamic endopeptidase [Chryseobacterium sp.]MPS63373.1 CPBP family intramembrane metalloprotease [Chryseobacterium sp.]